MVVVFGSINLDLVFRVPVLPRPGQTVSGPSYACLPGGKGANQALAAARAGSSVVMAGAVGGDPFGRMAIESLRLGGVDLSRVAVCEAPTGCAAVCVDDHAENQIVVASGANAYASERSVETDLLSAESVLLLQNEVSLEQSEKLAQRARARGARVVWNAAPVAPLTKQALQAIDVLVVNALEAHELASSLGIGRDAPIETAQALAEYCGCEVVVTCGSSGSIAVTHAGLWEIPSLQVQAADTTGAGDAFVGVLASAMDRGLERAEAYAWASTAAAMACLGSGAQAALPTASAIAASRPRLGMIKVSSR